MSVTRCVIGAASLAVSGTRAILAPLLRERREDRQMEILQTAISALVVASVGLILARLAGQRFDALEASIGRVEQRLDGRIDVLDAKFESRDAKFESRFDTLEAKFDGKFDTLEAKFDGKFDALDRKFDTKFDALDRKFDTKIDALRADITQIALAVGARPARETG
jgi:hypothetical protein